MTSKLVSSGAVIAKVFRDFKPSNSSWIVDAIEWINDSLADMQLQTGYDKTWCDIEVAEHRAKIPCPLEYLGGVEYEGCKLREVAPNARIDALHQQFANLENLNIHTSASYEVNPDYFHFSFPTGVVRIYHWQLPLDEKGYPMIPEDPVVLKALSWYIMLMYLQRGGTHPVIKWADALSLYNDKYMPQAKNRAKRMTVGKAERFKRNWLSLYHTVDRETDHFSFMKYYSEQANNNIADFTGTTISS